MEEFMYYTVYKITNQINDKIYIGVHKTKNLSDDYMGSGADLKNDQAKYGIENFKKEILFIFDNSDEMYAKEKEIVDDDFLKCENVYNLKTGGDGGWDNINKNRTEEDKKKLSRAGNFSKNRNRSGCSKKAHITMKKRGYKNAPPPGFKNKKHTEETKLQIGKTNSEKQSGEKNSQYGTMWITNGTENIKIKKDESIPEGWFKGRKLKNNR
jgi:hypothetical protein